MKRTPIVTALTAAALLLGSCVEKNPRPPTAPPVAPDIVIYDAWWETSYSLDRDTDTYTSLRRLYFDVNAQDGGTHTVYARIEYSPSSGSTWLPYLTTNAFTISGTASTDAYWVAVGQPNTELLRNTYDFRIRVYDASTNQLLATRDETGDNDLNDQRFETSAEDQQVTPGVVIYDAWWDSAYSLDYDADTYTSRRRLYFDVDVQGGGTRTVYAIVDYSPSSGSTWLSYLTTNTFTITGTAAADAYWIAVGQPNTELPHNTYDFRVRVFDASTNQLLATRDESSDTHLNDQRFETDAEDPTEVYLFETYWYDTLDYDGDGYFRYGKLAADADAVDSISSYWVYLRVYYRPSGTTTYTLYFQTDAYQIVGDASDDVIWVGIGAPNAELPRGAYDFLVEAYRSDTPTLQDWLGPADEPEDLQQWFVEPASMDVR